MNLPQESVILARVSTEEQKKKGHSIPAQVQRLREYNGKQGLKTIKEFAFDESSSKDKRVKFEQMLEFVQQYPKPLALCCDTIDRLQRSFVHTPVLDKLRREGKITIHFYRDGLIVHQHSNSAEILRWDIGVVMARNVALNISDNVKRSVTEKIRKREWPGKAPIGYINTIDPTSEKPTIKPDPLRSSFVKQAFELYASGLYSITQVVEFVSEDGLRNKTSNKPLTVSQLHRIIRNPFYYGEMLIKGSKYPHKYKPLIDRNLFYECQQVLEGRHSRPVKLKTGKEFVFGKGILKCADCGCTVTSDLKKGKYVYLRCTKYRRKCKGVRVKEEQLVAQIGSVFDSISIPKNVMADIQKQMQITHEAKKEYQQEAITSLNRQYTKLQSKKDRLLDLMIDESITKDEYDKKLEQVTQEQYAISRKLEQHTSADEQFILTVTYLLDLCSKAKELFESSETAKKRALIGFVLSNLQLDGKKLVYELKKPFDVLVSASKNHTWLPVVDTFRTKYFAQILELGRELQHLGYQIEPAI